MQQRSSTTLMYGHDETVCTMLYVLFVAENISNTMRHSHVINIHCVIVLCMFFLDF